MIKNNIKKLLIVGCGGQGRVVYDTATKMACWNEISFIDDKFPSLRNIGSIKVISKIKNLKKFEKSWSHLIVAIGDNMLRKKIFNNIKKNYKFYLANIIHPSAQISNSNKIGQGNVIFANSILAYGSKINNNNIINHGAIIDHDCFIGSNSHVASNVTLTGNIKIGNNVFIGSGTSIINDVSIGNNVVIGSNSLVNKNIKNNKFGFGIPFSLVKKK